MPWHRVVHTCSHFVAWQVVLKPADGLGENFGNAKEEFAAVDTSGDGFVSKEVL